MGANVDRLCRCWISERRNDGRPNIVPESGRSSTQDEHLFHITAAYYRNYGTPNIIVLRNH